MRKLKLCALFQFVVLFSMYNPHVISENVCKMTKAKISSL